MTFRWIPNMICAGRILLVAPIVVLLFAEAYPSAFALIVIAGLSDALDGLLARKFSWRTDLGSLLDPAADKLLVASVFLTLTYMGIVPLGLTVVVLVRDGVIIAGALAYRLLIAKVHCSPTAISKLNTAAQLTFVGFSVMEAAFGWPDESSLVIMGAFVVFTSVTSGLSYAVRWSKPDWWKVYASQ
ncbi:MAG TPA: CDP-alcohol phosphatidyltransferase family protein [Alphaproteobacteria bacterium]|nr:CDP-alcohol phosphatidyltransferase family protein [Alphaproteobacteria bacterium]